MLNAHDEFLLLDVLVERLDDGTAVEVAEILVRRDELLLVQATGPRGRPARRSTHPGACPDGALGPYHVRGYLHALPGVDPLLAVRRRRVMVPLTDATIESRSAASRRSDERRDRRREPRLVRLGGHGHRGRRRDGHPELPIAIDTGPLVKDFTGDIRGVSTVSMSEPPEVVAAGR